MNLILMGGSLRPGSINRRFLVHLAARLAQQVHRTSTFLGEALRLPLYEDGLPVPAGISSLKEELLAAQGLILVSPEYNAGIPAHLKNAVDWLSVQKPNPLAGLPVLLCACSPGALGGARALIPWRTTLANLGAVVVPEAISVPRADQALDPEGAPLDQRAQDSVRSALAAFLSIAARLQAHPA
ncbi:MAG: NADPH-dependent FMN reductase [Microthrixaceae bacterium]